MGVGNAMGWGGDEEIDKRPGRLIGGFDLALEGRLDGWMDG